MKLKRRISVLTMVMMALLVSAMAIVLPNYARAAGSQDRTALISPTLKGVVSQNGQPVTDTVDPEKPFDVKVTFRFPIIKDSMIGSPAAGGIDKASDQVNDGDYAEFSLGENFKATEASGNSVPVYLQAPGSPDDGKQVGTITLTQDGGGPVTARMTFHDPNGQFEFESNGRRDLTVHFTGHYQASEQSSQTPGSNKRFVKVLDKTYSFPTVEEKVQYSLTKAGALDDASTKESITWISTVKKTSSAGATNLGGETFTDNLSKVGEYVAGSFTVNNQAIDDALVYDAATKTVTYVFPNDFQGSTAKISFQTKVPNPATTVSVTNEATLKIPNAEEKRDKTTVVVHRPVELKKNLLKIDVNKDTGERELIWTIIAGNPYESYGPAWVGDILSGSLDGQKAPKRVDVTYEHSMTGKDGSWTQVTDVQAPADPTSFPKFPEGEDKTCPDLSAYNAELYKLGAGWHEPTKPVQANDEYKPVENRWFFIKNLSGQYRITVKQIYDANTEIGPLKNDAEIHTCAEVVYPKNPPVYSGLATIEKHAMKSYKSTVLNQGLLPWSVTVDFTNVFPSDEHFAYECFYYGSEDAFDAEKNTLQVQGSFDQDLLKKLIAGEQNETFFNFNQAYVSGSLSYKDKNATEGQPGTKLAETVLPIVNASGTKVGEIVKISGFSKIKKYTFTLNTRAQNIIEHLQKTLNGSFELRYKNTAVLAVGSGATLKTLSAVDRYELPGNLLDKFAMEYDAKLDKMDDVSKNGWKSSWRDFITGIPEVDTTKTFNHKNRTILFRIDVNPQGLKLGDYLAQLGGTKPAGDFTKLTIQDSLQDGLTLVPVEDGGPDYYLYQAEPGTPGFIDYGGVVIPGSAPFASFMPPGKAVKKLTPDQAKLTFDKANMTWTFKQYDGTPYFIVMRAKVSEDVFEKLMKSTPQGEEITFKNSVTLTAGDQKLASATGSASVTSTMLSKQAPKVVGDRLAWSFDYKPFDITLHNVVLKDTLDKNIGIPIDEKGNAILENFTIKRSNQLTASGEYKNYAPVTVVTGTPQDGEIGLRYDVHEHTITFTLPETPEGALPYAYRFEYETILKPVDLTANAINNHVELSADLEKPGASGHAELKTQEYAAFATIQNYPYAVIKKVDEQDKPLAGAVFQYTDNANQTVTSLSNADGVLYVIKLAEGTTTVTETTAPDGYLKLKDPLQLEVSGNDVKVTKAPDNAEGTGSFDSPLLVKNKKVKTTTISVTKQWQNDTPAERPSSITITLIRNGQPTDKTLVLDAEHGWTGSFEQLPVLDEGGNPVVYTVDEIAVEGYKSTIAGNQKTGFTITNTKPDKPHEPGKPPKPGKPHEHGTPKQPKKSKKSLIPQTGDTTSGYCLAGLTLTAALAALFLGRRLSSSRIG